MPPPGASHTPALPHTHPVFEQLWPCRRYGKICLATHGTQPPQQMSHSTHNQVRGCGLETRARQSSQPPWPRTVGEFGFIVRPPGFMILHFWHVGPGPTPPRSTRFFYWPHTYGLLMCPRLHCCQRKGLCDTTAHTPNTPSLYYTTEAQREAAADHL